MPKTKKPNKPKKQVVSSKPKPERLYPEISTEKETLLILVVENGMSIKNAALKIKRTPHAVYEWFRDDTGFIDCVARHREQLHERLRAEYSNLPEIAYNAIRENLTSELADGKLALSFLRETGNLIKTTGKENADEKAQRAAQALVSELLNIAEQSD